MAEQYRSALTQNDLISSATVATITGQFVKLGERKIFAGELLALGVGDASGQDNAVGRLFVDIRDNGTSPGLVHNGLFRLTIYSPQNRPLQVLCEFRTETARQGSTDRSLQVPFPVRNEWLSEDKKLVLEFMADTGATLSKANTQILIDITVEAV